MHMSTTFGAVAASLMIAAAAATPADAANGSGAVDVDVELVLAVDVSLSMDEREYQMEMRGYANAFRNQAVQEAIQMGGTGRIAVALMQWSGYGTYKLSVGWTLLDGAGAAEGLARAIEATARMPGGSTSISGAIDKALTLFDGDGFDGARRVIDISGDGRNNNGRDPVAARQEAVAQGIVINGLPIAGGEPGLEEYYHDTVIGGPGAFMVVAHGFDDFGQAISKKLIAEIANISPDLLPEPVQRAASQGAGGTAMLALN
jgi:hypothetical protein